MVHERVHPAALQVRAACDVIAELAAQPVSHLDDAELVALLQPLGLLRRLADVAGVRAAAEVAKRSATKDDASLAHRHSERSAADLVATHSGLPVAEARRWCAIGVATAPRISMLGEALPPLRPGVARSFSEGTIGVDIASTALRALDEVEPHVDLASMGELEIDLVGWAAELGERDFGRLCCSLRDRLDPDGAEPREDELPARSGVRVSRNSDGAEVWVLTMHPEASGILAAAVDARTAPRRQPTFDLAPVPADEAAGMDDRRTLSQRRFDAIVDIARESLTRDGGDLAGTAVTMLVTVSEEALRTGVGAAHIAGVDGAISAGTARRLAAGAEIIPVVLGGECEVLDLGRGRRLFSSSQRRAMALRDEGCIWPGCPAPPGWCEVAHLRPWSSGGPTDLGNGALMCPFHHRRFDNDGWRLETGPNGRSLIPPPWVDSMQTPRRVRPRRAAA